MSLSFYIILAYIQIERLASFYTKVMQNLDHIMRIETIGVLPCSTLRITPARVRVIHLASIRIC